MPEEKTPEVEKGLKDLMRKYYTAMEEIKALRARVEELEKGLEEIETRLSAILGRLESESK